MTVTDIDGFAILVQVSIFEGDKKGVEVSSHGSRWLRLEALDQSWDANQAAAPRLRELAFGRQMGKSEQALHFDAENSAGGVHP